MLKPYTIPKVYQPEQFSELIKIRPKKLLASNSKLSKDNIWQFTLPAAKASVVIDGKLQDFTVCFGAKKCLEFCYASAGSYIFRASMVAHARNLQFVLDSPFDFAEMAIKEIQGKRNAHAIRLHDAGDWFSRAYFMVWKSIMEACPNVNFYCYTKALPLIKKLEAEGMLPANFTVVYSEGGKFDHLIDKSKDRHSHVFSTEEDAIAAGYTLAHESDLPASDRNVLKVGLVVHSPIVYQNKVKRAVAEMNA